MLFTRCVRTFGRRFGTTGKPIPPPARRNVNEDDLVKLVGSRKELNRLMRDEEEEEVLEIPEHLPYTPGYLLPPPPRGTRNAKLHRQSDILRKRPPPKNEESVIEDVTAHEDVTESMAPVPWRTEVDLRPQEALIDLPPPRPAFSECCTYSWKRTDYIPGIGDIYPDDNVQVNVTLTNSVEASEAWAQERLEEGQQIYGLETKWWTWEEAGVYYSDSYPGMWSDLALLQIATERNVLLLQPLDVPVEKLGPALRDVLKYKFLKKASFRMEAKAKALKMCQIKVHGCHDFGHLLKRQLGVEHVSNLPVDFSRQDLSTMARLLLGLDLAPREVCKAHWESPYLSPSWVELAAKEAWCCWALYGVVTRMERPHVELWNSCLPEIFHSDDILQERAARKNLLKQHGTVLHGVASYAQPPNWKVAKKAAVELVCDLGLDLKNEFNSGRQS